MAKSLNIDEEKQKDELIKILRRAVQSANLNFILGSGCSYPAIKTLSDVEKRAEQLIHEGKVTEADKILAEFLKPFVDSTEQLFKSELDGNHQKVLAIYKHFIENISNILFERKNNILFKQANIFTTNYDLFIEKAHEELSDVLRLNDGFNRTPSLKQEYLYSPQIFFDSLNNTGNLYKYKVEVPSVNLIKLHGSLNWELTENNIEIIQSCEYLDTANDMITKDTVKNKPDAFLDLFTLILPKKDKFAQTLLNRTYYDLLRIYQNELDKENTLLIAEGFSFADEHIYDLTKRALKNPTLRLIVFCFDKNKELSYYEDLFASFPNVNIIYSETDEIKFDKFNDILDSIVPVERNKDKDLNANIPLTKEEENEDE